MDWRVVLKEIKEYKSGDTIPSNAKFLHARDRMIGGGARSLAVFYYEVPIAEKSGKTITMADYRKEINEVVDYLNMAAGKSYKSSTEETRKLIFKWLKADWTVDQFKVAIDNMCGEWLGDPKWEAYLRPKTLFGSKFESYYNKARPITHDDVFGDLDNALEGIK